MNSTDNQSLLAAIHNWEFHSLPRRERPATASPAERYATYAIGVLLLAATGLAAGVRRHDTPRALLIIAGLLIGLSFVVSPIVHNYYYVLLLPVAAALLDRALPSAGKAADWKVLLPVAIFMAVDLAARLPTIGPVLRDLGLPLLSMLGLLGAGAAVLARTTRVDSAQPSGALDG